MDVLETLKRRQITHILYNNDTACAITIEKLVECMVALFVRSQSLQLNLEENQRPRQERREDRIDPRKKHNYMKNGVQTNPHCPEAPKVDDVLVTRIKVTAKIFTFFFRKCGLKMWRM